MDTASSSILAPLIPTSSEKEEPNPSKPSKTIFFISLICIAFVVIAVCIAFIFSFHCFPIKATATLQSTESIARPLAKLSKPTVIMISSDGFRFGYQHKTRTPNIHRLIADGTTAENGLIPVFPTSTFPNHYSIATGLFPAYHGIISNHFRDPKTGETFKKSSLDPNWWLGEPIWVTVANNCLKAATYMWPGSQVKKGVWDCPKNYCPMYNQSVPFEERVDTILRYFDLPCHEIPSFMNLYFSDPDIQGHAHGPDHPEITSAVAHIDKLIGKLIKGLKKRGVFNDVTIIFLGDHGMVSLCENKIITLDDLKPWIEIPPSWVESYTPVLSIRPPTGISPAHVVYMMNQGLKSGKVENGKYLKVALKKNLPKAYHYVESDRITPVIGLAAEGFKVEQKRTGKVVCGGAHGYDHKLYSMRTIFIAHGPQFAKGRKVPSFQNVEIYNMVAAILKIKGAPNNGTGSFADSIILPSS